MPTRLESLLDLDSLLTPEDLELRAIWSGSSASSGFGRTSRTGSNQAKFQSAIWQPRSASWACSACI